MFRLHGRFFTARRNAHGNQSYHHAQAMSCKMCITLRNGRWPMAIPRVIMYATEGSNTPCSSIMFNYASSNCEESCLARSLWLEYRRSCRPYAIVPHRRVLWSCWQAYERTCEARKKTRIVLAKKTGTWTWAMTASLSFHKKRITCMFSTTGTRHAEKIEMLASKLWCKIRYLDFRTARVNED